MAMPKFFAFILVTLLSPFQTQNSPTESAPIPKFNCDIVLSPDKSGATSTPSPEPLWLLYAQERKLGFKEGTVRIKLTFDAYGAANTASIVQSSGNEKIDQATVNWSLCTKIKPGTLSSAVIPVMYRW